MPDRIPVFSGPSKSKAQRSREAKQRQRRRAYATNSATWRAIRASVLNAEPLCRGCKGEGTYKAATVVDHIDGDAHNNDRPNLQPLCETHHNSKTAKDNHRYGRW